MQSRSGPMIMIIGPEAGAGKTGATIYDLPRAMFFGVRAKIMTTAHGLVGIDTLTVIEDCNRLDLLTYRLEEWADTINEAWPAVVIDDVNDMIASYASALDAEAPINKRTKEKDSFHWSKNTTTMIARFKAALRAIRPTRILTGHYQPPERDGNGLLVEQGHLKMPLRKQRGAIAQDAQVVGLTQPWKGAPNPYHKWGLWLDNNDKTVNVTDRLGVVGAGSWLPLNLREYLRAAGHDVPARAAGFEFLDPAVEALLEAHPTPPEDPRAFCLSYARSRDDLDPRHIRWILRDYFDRAWYNARDPLAAMFG